MRQQIIGYLLDELAVLPCKGKCDVVSLALRHMGGSLKFDCIIVTGQDVGCDKKSGRSFHKLITRAESLGIERADIAFVGDDPEADIDGAKCAGLKAVLIRRPPLSCEIPDHEITSLMGLLDVLIP